MSLSPDTGKENTTAFDEGGFDQADFEARFAHTLAKIKGDRDRPDFLMAPDEKRRERLRQGRQHGLRLMEVVGSALVAGSIGVFVLTEIGIFSPGSPAQANELPDSPQPNISTRTFPVVDVGGAIQLAGHNIAKLPNAVSISQSEMEDMKLGLDGNLLTFSENNINPTNAAPLAGQPNVTLSVTHGDAPTPVIDLSLDLTGNAWTATLQVAENVADYNNPGSVISGMNSVFDQLGVCATLSYEDGGGVISGLSIKPLQDCAAAAKPAN